LSFFIQENKYNRITLYDAKLKLYENTMFVYIKDNSIKEKTRINSLKEMFNKPIFSNKLKVFNQYLKDLAEDWDIIILGQNIKYHNLIYSNNYNVLFLNITSEKKENSVQDIIIESTIGGIAGSVQSNVKSMNPYISMNIQSNLSIFEYLIEKKIYLEQINIIYIGVFIIKESKTAFFKYSWIFNFFEINTMNIIFIFF
jgi:hypothetical protein